MSGVAEEDVDRRDIYLTLDLALRLGELLMSSGAGAADVKATMLSVVHGLGLRNSEADVTFTTLMLSYQRSQGEATFSRRRDVTHRTIDYGQLTDVDRIVRALLLGEIDRDEARSAVASLTSTGHKTPRIAISIGWGFMSMGAAIVIGGDWVVTLIAFFAAIGVDITMRELQRRRMPTFYQQAAGGAFATLLAVGLAAARVPVDPTLVIAAAIILLLSGIAFMGAMQDALTGFYLTSAARGMEIMIMTAGIITGVTGGLAVASKIGLKIVITPTVPATWLELPIFLFGGALCAAAFAYSSYAPLRSLAPIALVGIVAQVIYRSVLVGFGVAWASAAAAVVVGLISYTLAERVRVPPLVVVVSGVVPLLPGLSVYSALSLLAEGSREGLVSLARAVAIGGALAAGVILGQYVAQPLRRQARRLEQRLAGPRLVGPLRAASVKEKRRS